ncbi:MAG: penicillin-binding protein 2 [Anaerolineaceae bacterium]|nr:penicillin-binding protein 2 [Anaerolineaceae bacterium]
MKNLSSRLTIIGVVFTTFAALVVVQIFSIQHNPEMIETSDYLEYVNSFDPINHEAERGRIYDRNGNLLAGSKTVYEIGIDFLDKKTFGGNATTIANTIMQYFGEEFDLDYATITAAADKDYDKDKEGHVYHQFYQLNNIPQETIDELEDLKEYYNEQKKEMAANGGKQKNSSPSLEMPSIEGLVWLKHLQRNYPENELAGNILGFTSFLNPDAKIGVYGVEAFYEEKLITEDVYDKLPRKLYEEYEIHDLPEGDSLILTIDRDIQQETEKILDEAVDFYGAEAGTIIVMNPRNGEILAMAANPRINPNQYWKMDEEIAEGQSYNKAIMDIYEPGSVFKTITMAIALETGSVTPETEYEDTGVINIGGADIYNWNLQGFGLQNMEQCLKKSSNVCLAWVAAEKIGLDNFYKGLHSFGLDRRTNIDLANEGFYPLKVPGSDGWYPVDLGRQAYGHSIAVTPIQMITAISALANEGKIMAPHILRSVVSEGVQYNNQPQVMARPISAETAKIVSEMLVIPESQEDAETWNAYIPGYSISGKTGTAVFYQSDHTNTSFVGWGPTEDPQFIVYVWLENPSASTWASVVAAPVFKEVVEYLIIKENIPPDNIRIPLDINHEE